MNITIRSEMPGDVDAIQRVTELAFREAPHTDHTEQYIVNALRESGQLSISLVAELNGEIVAHVAISPVVVSESAENCYGLGPISVLPSHQGKGIGSQLMVQVLADLKSRGAEACVLLGDPNYYSRFGFVSEGQLFLAGVPPEYFQVLSFSGRCPKGEVFYHDAFSATGE